MDLDRLSAWWRDLVRDLVIVGIATFLLVHEAVASDEPSAVLVTLAGSLLLAPAALRADARRRANGNGNSERKSVQTEERDLRFRELEEFEDRWGPGP